MLTYIPEVIVIVRYALHVKSMNHKLFPPYMMREAGVIVNDVTKIHVDDPTV